MTKKEYSTSYGNIVYFEHLGNQLPILFLHGLGCCGSLDYPEIVNHDELKKHRCIIVDLLGSGLSDKPMHFEYNLANHARLLADFINSLNIEKLALYGHSMGGTIAILLAELIPDKVQSLILSEANLDSGGGTFSRKVANSTLENFCQLAFPQLIKDCSQSASTNDVKWAKGLEKTLPKAFYEEATNLVKGHEKSWRSIFYELPMPKTYIFGENSLPDNDVHLLQKHNINIIIIKNAGHSMAWENPNGLSVAITSVL